jgi:hypothetical protein
LHGALGKECFLKKLKTVFADGLCQVRSAQDFLKKKENNLCRWPMTGALGTGFFKKK